MREIYEAEEKARMSDIAEIQYAEECAERRGIEQGIGGGIQLGQQHLLLRLMTSHIGEIPPGIWKRLEMLTSEQLDELGDALFRLHSYSEVEEWLSKQ